MPATIENNQRDGLVAAVGAYTLWGLLPLYWKLVDQVPALEIMAHRMLWCFGLLFGYLLWRRKQELASLKNTKLLAALLVSGLLIGFNWFLFVWSVAAEQLVEVSLGYYINPLVNVLFGVLLFGERLRKLQWLSILLAALGVGWLTWNFGRLPWVSLGLALSFGLYAVARKRINVSPIAGLTAETGLLSPFCLLWLFWISSQNTMVFAQQSLSTDLLLIAAGPATAAPLLLFAFAARRISLSLLGILQYIGPSLTLWLGVVVYDEPFTGVQLVAFLLIWTGLLIYLGESLWVSRRSNRNPAATAIHSE